MQSDVRISQAESQEHFGDLLAAIGGKPVDAERWFARRGSRRQARESARAARFLPGWRRAARA